MSGKAVNNSRADAQPQQLWREAIERLRGEIGDEATDLWLKPVEVLRLENGVLQVKVPNKLFSTGIKDHYQKRLSALLREISGSDIEIDYEVSKDLKSVLPDSDPISEAPPQ